MQQERYGRGGNGGEFGEGDHKQQRREREWQQNSEQRNDEDVDRQSNGRDAVEVDGHRQRHEELDGKRSGDEFDDQEGDTDGAGKNTECEPGTDEPTHRGGEHADDDAKLSDARRERGVNGEQPEVAGGAEVGTEGSFGNGNCDARDGEDGEQRHLKAGVEERRRIDGEHDERGESDGVEGVAFAPEHAATEIEGDHPKRALHGLAEACEVRVGKGQSNGGGGGRSARKVQVAGDPEDEAGEDGEVHAGDDKQVEGAGAFEAHAESMTEESTVAGKHCSEHRGVVVGEA